MNPEIRAKLPTADAFTPRQQATLAEISMGNIRHTDIAKKTGVSRSVVNKCIYGKRHATKRLPERPSKTSLGIYGIIEQAIASRLSYEELQAITPHLLRQSREFILAPNNPFTKRQEEILNLALQGVLPRKEIADKLGISLKTLENHLYGILRIFTKDPTLKNKCSLGIFGVIETNTGERPKSLEHAVECLHLLGNIVIEKPTKK